MKSHISKTQGGNVTNAEDSKKFICDKCNKEFALKNNKSILCDRVILEDNPEETFWLTFFVCPHCNHQFNICIDSYESRRIAKGLDEKMRTLPNTTDRKQREIYISDIAKLRKSVGDIRRLNIDKYGVCAYHFAGHTRKLKMDFVPEHSG